MEKKNTRICMYLYKDCWSFLSFQVAEKILNKKELEFYKWDGDLSQLLQNVREKINRVAEVISLEPFFTLAAASIPILWFLYSDKCIFKDVYCKWSILFV